MANPESKMIIEVKINDQLCDVSKDERLSKDMMCFQLGKRLGNKLDTDAMTIIIRVFRGMDKLMVVNIHNHQAFRLTKKGADDIKKLIAKELANYIENPTKEIAKNQADDAEAGGPLYQLLRSKGAVLGSKSEDGEGRSKEDAAKDYKVRCAQYKAFKNTFEINKQLKELDKIYTITVTSDSDISRPLFYYQLMREGTAYLWFSIDTPIEGIMKTVEFLDSFAAETYLNTIRGIKLRMCYMVDSLEYEEDYLTESEFVEHYEDYGDWASPRIEGFSKKMISENDEDDSEMDMLPFYEDSRWLAELKNATFRLIQVETDRAKKIMLNRVLF